MSAARRRRPLPGWVRIPPLTIRARLTLTYTALFTVGGAALLVGLTTAFYRAVYRPLPADAIPSRLDPDHDHFIGLRDQIRDAAVSHLLRDSLLLLLVVVAVSALLGWWVAGRLLRPLAAITAAARRATGTTLHERLNLPGPQDELKQLGDTFDEMLERLDATFAAQRRFVANASHELRTPLTVTRTAVEVTTAKPRPTTAQWRTMAQDVTDSTQRAQRLIDALLVLARSEQRVTDVEDDDLADVTAEALDHIAARSAARGLHLETDLAPAPLRGNLALLDIAVTNLLENAVKYNHDGGLLRVTTGTVPMADDCDAHREWAQVSVSNAGPVLDPDHVEELFEPFERGVHTRRSTSATVPDGVGLGLSIVRAVALAHDGHAQVAARPEGGLTVTLRVPRAPDQHATGAAG
ncbi:HAMP domain-containing sensor histidine kinase [Streptomyces sp. SL13]|uniref:histidine kinase n=1 Tax=Streptantibioticus silvisoli TaxID=2705255 RepID=A0AA90KC55_9ACTN|nr:HAMP domain-containing sensor histidine kinase [Streptantibioticus silvisoli]MDI5974097.1 HAMP domain-containing sensor histidine kinase [Streptantibioticus silvisoli]